jgi:phosphoenolpyruvate phosphomutase
MTAADPLDPRIDVFGPRALWFGVYDALSARLVAAHEEAASDSPAAGLWLSSYCVSAALRACPDASIVGSAEMMAIARLVTAAAPRLPLVIDCDSGYGDATVFGFVVREIERTCRAAAVCIEDKAFPKRNSFYVDWAQALDPVETFQEKIAAGQTFAGDGDERVSIIARTEALVLGAGVDEAVYRLGAYAEAGADALMVQATGNLDEILGVAKRWRRISDVPMVCAPTAFPSIPPADFWDAGFSVFIYANQLLRTALRAQIEFLDAVADEGAVVANVASGFWTIAQLNDLVGATAFSRSTDALAP